MAPSSHIRGRVGPLRRSTGLLALPGFLVRDLDGCGVDADRTPPGGGAVLHEVVQVDGVAVADDDVGFDAVGVDEFPAFAFVPAEVAFSLPQAGELVSWVSHCVS